MGVLVIIMSKKSLYVQNVVMVMVNFEAVAINVYRSQCIMG